VRPAGEALRHEAAHAHRAAGGQQVVGGLGAEPVGLGEVAVEVTQVERGRQRRELVNDHVRLRLGDRAGHRVGIEGVGDDGRRTHGADPVCLRRAARHAGYVVPLRDEPRDELLADCAGRAGYQDLHGVLLSCLGSTRVTREDARV
jgi:hypothetical protein